jgi:hypothetical protein
MRGCVELLDSAPSPRQIPAEPTIARLSRSGKQGRRDGASKGDPSPAEDHRVRTPRRLLTHIALLACVAGGALATTHEVEEPVPPKPRVVVAAIDSAPNPYHEFFRAGGGPYLDAAPDSVTPDVLEELGIGPEHIIRTTFDEDGAPDLQADLAQYDAIEAGQPYWYEGTNLIGISFDPGDGERLRPDEGSTHGIGVAASVLNANPEAIVVVVESPSIGQLGAEGYATKPLGEAWSFSHPAVDIITTSYGPPGSPPLGYHNTDSYLGVVEQGKLHFGASDNSPALSPVDANSGPWWTIGIAGFGENSHNGRESQSGSLPDFLADWTQQLPYCRDCTSGTSNVSGTSFATPTSAGVASRVLLEARRAAGHLRGIVTEGVDAPLMVAGEDAGEVAGEELTLTNWQLRRALEQAAFYPAQSDWSQGQGHTPIIDAAPWSTAAWGVITSDPERDVIGQALAHLGLGDAPTRSKSDEACTFMTANIDARQLYWDTIAQGSQSNGTTADPYLPC